MSKAIKKSVSFTVEIIEMVERFPARIHGLEEFSTKLQEMVEDLTTLIERTNVEIRERFTEAEMNYLKDMLNSTLMSPKLSYRSVLLMQVKDADRYEGLGSKWQVDPGQLSQKIEALTEFECYVIAKLVDEFWQNQSKKD